MKEQNVSLHLQNLNNKIKLMNQTGSKSLTLTAQEARSIHNDIFDLLNHIATLSKQLQAARSGQTPVVQITMDGGSFK